MNNVSPYRFLSDRDLFTELSECYLNRRTLQMNVLKLSNGKVYQFELFPNNNGDKLVIDQTLQADSNPLNIDTNYTVINPNDITKGLTNWLIENDLRLTDLELDDKDSSYDQSICSFPPQLRGTIINQQTSDFINIYHTLSNHGFINRDNNQYPFDLHKGRLTVNGYLTSIDGPKLSSKSSDSPILSLTVDNYARVHLNINIRHNGRILVWKTYSGVGYDLNSIDVEVIIHDMTKLFLKYDLRGYMFGIM